MDVDRFLRDPLSRRRLFSMSGVAVVGASATFLGACGDDTSSPIPARFDESDQADVEILNSALDLELMAVAAYTAGAAVLKGELLRLAKRLREQEQEHADGLASAIRHAGGKPNVAKVRYELPELRSPQDVLRFAVDLENTAIASYIDALPKLGQGDLRAMTASIMSNEAEHVSILLGALDMEQVPSAFVVGKAA